ncbi:MAG: hypothetical protein ACIWVG_20360 [Gloeotrichia echinulata HAB0833]
MATSKKGPTKGGRILVKLPFGKEVKPSGKKPGKNQYVRVKQGVAKELGLDPVSKIPTVDITGKGGHYTRIGITGSFRQQSITIIFTKARAIKGGGSYKTVSLPLGSGCTVTDAVEWLQKKEFVAGVRTQSGQTIRWKETK